MIQLFTLRICIISLTEEFCTAVYSVWLKMMSKQEKSDAGKKEETMLPENPDMLASFLNMKLRDHYPTLDALCEDLELDKEEITKKLKEADYDYIPARNQFL